MKQAMIKIITQELIRIASQGSNHIEGNPEVLADKILAEINTPEENIKLWQEFEKKYEISKNYQPYEQIIYTAFQAGFQRNPQ